MATHFPALSAKSGLEKANALFVLSQKPAPATERAWELYTANRQGAERFPGMKIPGKQTSNNEEDEADEVEEDEDDDSDEDDMPHWGEGDDIYVLRKIRSTLTKIEKEMGLKDTILQRSFRMLSCDALFEEEDQVKVLYLTSATATHVYGSPVPSPL